METLIYAANILYLLSYLVRDILYLRLLTVVAACCLVTYFYNQAEPLMTVIYWNLFFVTLNVLQLTRILWERYRITANVQHQTAESAANATWCI
jgi:hypothetical protein